MNKLKLIRILIVSSIIGLFISIGLSFAFLNLIKLFWTLVWFFLISFIISVFVEDRLKKKQDKERIEINKKITKEKNSKENTVVRRLKNNG